MNEKNKYEAFKDSCRTYLREKAMLAKMNPNTEDPLLKTRYRFLKEDVAYTEKMLDKLEEKCGTNARLMVYELLIENRTQTQVAKDYQITRRQVQYSLEKWMDAILKDEEAHQEEKE